MFRWCWPHHLTQCSTAFPPKSSASSVPSRAFEPPMPRKSSITDSHSHSHSTNHAHLISLPPRPLDPTPRNKRPQSLPPAPNPPTHHPLSPAPTLRFPLANPIAHRSDNSAPILPRDSDPDVPLFDFEDVGRDRCACEPEELLESGSEVFVRCQFI